ncbi:stage II sporulation protein M [Chitinimonas sp.]|uniref:stage II sporulation protein M n=1 Tax=Chitinimonas sp. TaxID=1934313 RepID=UPI0035ADB16F
MKQAQFEPQHQALWQQVATLLAAGGNDPALPGLYRQLCQHLALARQRGYSPQLTDYLHDLSLAAHRQLYGTPLERPMTLRHWLLVQLPQRVREEWRLLLLVCLLFWGLSLLVGWLVWKHPHWALSWSSWKELSEFERMYSDSAHKLGRDDNGASDVAMFGFYIWNNVSIDFRTFAGGLLGGIPTVIALFFNAVHFSVVAAWLSHNPQTAGNFWSFVITHSSFEITGLLLSAMAGLRLGITVLRPGRYSRRHALVLASRRVFPILVGAAMLTALAAFFEGFWSASPAISHSTKYIVGAICWTSVIGFFAFAGRRHAA